MARRLAAEERGRQFDLESDLPVRAMLLRWKKTDHVLLWTVHHIAFDGWSAEVLRDELARFTGHSCVASRRRSRSRRCSTPNTRSASASGCAVRCWSGPIAFWRKQMAEAPPVLNLPTDRRRPAERTERGGRLTATLDAPLVRALKDLGRGEGATLS